MKKEIKLKNEKFLLTFLVIIILTSIVIGQPETSSFVYAKDEPIRLSIPVYNYDGSLAENDTTCSFTVDRPNSTNIYSNEPMSFETSGIFSYNIPSNTFTENGKYLVHIACQNRADNAVTSFTLLITPSGSISSVAQGILYSILLFILVVFLIVSIVVGYSIDPNNEYDIGGNLMKINYKKHLKTGLFFISYLLLIFITSVSYNITLNFLMLSFASDVLSTINTVLWWGVIPIAIIVFVFSVIKWMLDLKLQDLADRGLKPYSGDKNR